MSTFILAIFYLLLPFQFALSPVEGIDLALVRVIAIGIFLLWIVVALTRQNFFIPLSWTTALFVSFLFLCAFSILFADIPLWGWRKFVFLLTFAPLYFVIAAQVRTHPISLQRILQMLVLGSAAVATIALLQFCSQFIFGVAPVVELWRSSVLPLFLGATFGNMVEQYSSLLVNINGTTLLRATAFFPDPHVAAYYFGMTLPIAFTLAWQTRQWLWKVSSGLIFIADLLTFSRGGYLALLTTIFLALLLTLRQASSFTQQKKLFLLFSGGLLVFFLGIVWSPLGSRFLSSFSFTEGSNQGRIAMWQAATDAIVAQPLTGVGLGNFPLFVKPSAEYREPIYAHNLYLDIMAETGILNGCIFLLFLMTAFLQLWHLGHFDPLFFGPAFGLFLFSIHSLVENPLFSVHIFPLLLLFLAFSTVSVSAKNIPLKEKVRV